MEGSEGSCSTHSRLCRQGGFTLVEIVVVLGVVAMSASVALFVSHDQLRGEGFRDERDTLVTLLQHARAEAMSGVCGSAACTAGAPHGIEILPDSFVLFEGDAYASRALSEDVAIAHSSHIAYSGAHEIVFQAGSGNAAASTIEIHSAEGKSSAITVGDAGQISWSK